jgi:hypothetical protein
MTTAIPMAAAAIPNVDGSGTSAAVTRAFMPSA